MATLNTLSLGTFTNGNSTATTGTEPVLQEIASAEDSTNVHDTANTTHVGMAQFTLEDVNEDLGNVDTLFIRLRYANSATPDLNVWDSLQARVFKSDGTTPLTNAVTVVSGPITTTTPTNSSVVEFTGVDTAASRADWDGAVVQIFFEITKTKGGDAIEERVFAAELTGTYTEETANPVVITASPAGLGVGAQAPSPALAGLAVGASPAAAGIAAQTLSPILAALAVGASPALISTGAQAVDPAGGGGGVTITDGFNRADSADLGSSAEGWSWAEVQNAAVWGIDTNRGFIEDAINEDDAAARAESDLGSADHYAQAVVSWQDTGARWGGVAVRYSPSATTFYAAEEFGAQGTNHQRIIKVEAGSITVLAEATPNGAASKTIRLEVSGSDLEMFVDGGSVLTAEDSDITGNERAGLRGQARTGTNRDVYFEDFEAGDLAAAGATVITASPASTTIGAQPPSLALAPLTIPASPGSLATIAQEADPVMAGLAVGVSPADVGLSASAVSPVLAALAAQASPATMVLAASQVNPEIAGAPRVISAAPAALVVAAQVLDPVAASQGIQVPVTPAGITPTAQIASPTFGALSLVAVPAIITVVGAPVSPALAAAVITATAAGVAVAGVAVSPMLAAFSVPASPGSLVAAAQILSPVVAGAPRVIMVTPAGLEVTAGEGQPTLGAQVVVAVPAAVATTAGVLSPALAALSVLSTPATLTMAAQPILVARAGAVFASPATIGVFASSTQPQIVVIVVPHRAWRGFDQGSGIPRSGGTSTRPTGRRSGRP